MSNQRLISIQRPEMLFSALIFFSSSLKYPRGTYSRRGLLGDQEPKIFDQLIDHTNPQLGTFKQRYIEVLTHYKMGGPVILEIGEETDSLTASGNGTDFLTVLAQDLNAAVVVLEHRFFGESMPAKTTTSDDYKLLTIQQAIDDLKYFQENYGEISGIGKTKWLITGGSYAGMLSALTRKMYPENFHAAISSSGVVLATDDYNDFDLQIAISMGEECASVARKTRMLVDELLDNEGTKDYVLNLFNSQGLTDQNFRFVIGEMFTLAPQYGMREKVCGPLVDAHRAGDDLVVALSKYAKDFFIPKFCDGSIYKTYADDYFKSLENTNENVGGRSWLWITCNELAYWQTSPGRLGLRSPKLTKEAFQEQCKNVFGEGIVPNVNAFNEKYGGLKQTATRVFFTTGSQDPWTWTCVTEESGVVEGSYAHTITGPNVGHCSDYHLPKATDQIDLVRTRKNMRDVIKVWMNEE